jgi:hypothetical protein
MSRTPLVAIRLAAFTMLTILVLAVAHAAAAGADSRACTERPHGAGCASFSSRYDRFAVCDNLWDFHSVAVYYRVNGGRLRHAVNYFGPHRFGGCRYVGAAGSRGSAIRWQVCLATHGHPGPPRMRHTKGTCSAKKNDRV